MHVLCTAGHVDHGKSSLVLALTGMQPDRFVEERRRGLTIDLGFAWFDLDSPASARGARTVAFVDLPGHQRFIANMLAGAGPVEIALLVVAADEGWMPQSQEHLEILDLLGVSTGIVAVTKTDLVDEETVDLAIAMVREQLAGSSLETARIVPVSARTGEGLGALRDAIGELLDQVGVASDRGRPRLWVDRVFTVKGAGTVVTGTLGGGSVAVGDQLHVLPPGQPARARNLQSLNRDVERIGPGSRVAINLAGVDRDEVGRGQVVAHADVWRPTSVFDAWVRAVPGQRLRSKGAWHAHVGSAEHIVRIWPLTGREIPGGTDGFARIELAGPVVVEAGDRFVLRDLGRRVTAGGGMVIDPQPLPRPRSAARRATRADQLGHRRAAIGDRSRLLELHVLERGHAPQGDALAAVGATDPVPPETLVVLADRYIARRTLDHWRRAILDMLASYHQEHPLERAAPRSLIDQAVIAAGCPAEMTDAVLSWLERAGQIEREGLGRRLPTHRVALDPEQEAARDRLLSELDENPFAPPGLSDAATRAKVTPALVRELEASGEIVRIASNIAITAGALERATTLLREASVDEPLTVSRARQALGTSRKYALPLLEVLDRRGVTRRVGDVRKFRTASRPGGST